MIEKASGQTYSDYLRDHIFKPAGMTSSGVLANGEILKQRADGYTASNGALRHADYLDWSLPYAAGAVYSSAEDLFRWDQALYGNKLANAATIASLTATPGEYTFGWFVDREGGRLRMLHEGSNPGFAAFIIRYPEDHAVVIVLANVETAPVREIANGIAPILFGPR